MNPLRVIEVCAGIGGIALGFEMAGGFEHVAFVENNDYACTILTKHWPEVPQFRDIRDTSAWSLPDCDVLAGGIPCQPHSLAGKRGAGADERDLWPEFFRLVCEIRPKYAVVENVPGLRSSEHGQFFGRILRDLATVGYDAEWVSLSAADVGAPHKRERVWIVAYPNGQRQLQPQGTEQGERRRAGDDGQDVSDANRRRPYTEQERVGRRGSPANPDRNGPQQPMANANHQGLALGQSVGRGLQPQQPPAERGGAAVCNADYTNDERTSARPAETRRRQSQPTDRWPAQPGLGHAADGLSSWLGDWERGVSRTTSGYRGRADQLRCLGNAVLPQCAEVIGAYIRQHYEANL